MIPLGGLALAGVLLLLASDWRWQVAALVLGEALLTIWMRGLWNAVALAAWLCASWMAAAVLGTALLLQPDADRGRLSPFWGMRLAALVVAAAAARLSAQVGLPWLEGAARQLAPAATFWMAVGGVQLFLATRPVSLTTGLLAVLSAGTALVGVFEPSRLLLAGLLSWQVLLALLGGWLAQQTAVEGQG